jgi:hypothetical protein
MQKWFKQIHDPRIHQRVTRIDLQRTRSRIKAQLIMTILVASHAFHQTASMHKTERAKSRTGEQQTDRDSDSDQRNDELAAPPGTTTKNKRNQVLTAQHSMSQRAKMRQASDPRDGHQNRSADHGAGLKHEAVKTINRLQQEHQAD